MVLKATGYKSVPINGLPSDHKKCESQLFVRLMSIEKRRIVPNVRGRVVSLTSRAVSQAYIYVDGSKEDQ
ncbi:hypothetical protein YC2023_027889 [Brassica napus]